MKHLSEALSKSQIKNLKKHRYYIVVGYSEVYAYLWNKYKNDYIKSTADRAGFFILDETIIQKLIVKYDHDKLNIYEPLDKDLSKEDLANMKLTIDDVKRIF